MITHFQTCLYVSHKRPATIEEAFFELQKTLYNWFCRKEFIQEILEDRDILNAFCTRGDLSTYVRSDGSLKTEYYFEIDEAGVRKTTAWGMHYRHRDQQHSRLRHWITDVTLRKIENKQIVMFVRVSYEKDKYVLFEDEDPMTLPSPSVPKFVRGLLSNKKLKVSLDKNFTLPLQKVPFKADKVEAVNILFNWIDSYFRRYILIVVNGVDGKLVIIDELQKALLGKVMIVRLVMNSELRKYIDPLDSKHYVKANHVRFFYPVARGGFLESPSYDIDKLPPIKDTLIKNILGTYELHSSEAIQDISGIYQLVRMSDLRRRIHQKESEPDIHSPAEDSVADTIDKLRKENARLKEEADEFCRMVDQTERNADEEKESLSKELERLKKQLSKFKQGGSERERKIPSANEICSIVAKQGYPDTLVGILKFMRILFGERLIVTNEAEESARKYDKFKKLDKAWEMLTHLAMTLYEMKYEGGTLNKNMFKQKSGYDLAMAEGRMTQRDSGLMNLRKIVYEGAEYDITPHIKWGNKEPNCLRLYFAFVEKEKKILIGHFGEHLQNYTSQFR